MKVLVAPNKHTLDRVTSVGTVHFENGIATNFNDEQAQFFCERQRGFELQEIEDEAAPPAAEAKTEKATDEAPKPEESAAEVDPPKTEKTEAATEASQDAPEGAQAAPTGTSSDEGTEGQDDGEGDQNNGDGQDDGQDGDGDGFTLGGNIRGLAGITITSYNTDTDTLVDSTTSDDNGDWELPEPKDCAYEVRFEGEEVSGEDSFIGPVGIDVIPPAGDGDAPADEGGATAADGAGGKTSEEVTLPTTQNKKKYIRQFCRKHDIDDSGNKAVMLERIYADERFKKK